MISRRKFLAGLLASAAAPAMPNIPGLEEAIPGFITAGPYYQYEFAVESFDDHQTVDGALKYSEAVTRMISETLRLPPELLTTNAVAPEPAGAITLADMQDMMERLVRPQPRRPSPPLTPELIRALERQRMPATEEEHEAALDYFMEHARRDFDGLKRLTKYYLQDPITTPIKRA